MGLGLQRALEGWPSTAGAASPACPRSGRGNVRFFPLSRTFCCQAVAGTSKMAEKGAKRTGRLGPTLSLQLMESDGHFAFQPKFEGVLEKVSCLFRTENGP